jgi:undecaprenyl diphosphate synthase
MKSDGTEQFPVHIAIIMDGNGRWAAQQGLMRIRGHETGASNVEEIVTWCGEEGLQYLTLYAFSIDNWNRPAAEVRGLMKLLGQFLQEKAEVFHENGIRFRVIGRRDMLPERIVRSICSLESSTGAYTGMTLTLALSYGAQQEIADAVRDICSRAVRGEIDPGTIDPDMLGSCLESSYMPPPDMLVRTGGEMRLSNFFLWQASYSELFFTDTLWPEFTCSELEMMIRAYAARERRFGSV